MRPIATAFAALALLAPPASAAEMPGLSDLAFMAGCWTTAKDDIPVVRECYTAPHAGIMQGSAQTVAGGETIFYEFILIAESGGTVTYTPFLKGERSVSFPLVKASPGEAVFENLDHDFPKRIIYRKDGAALIARIEGASAGDPANQSWVMRPQGGP